MAHSCVLHHQPLNISSAFSAPSPSFAADGLKAARAKIWELSGQFHCSIVGTCLTAPELRQFFVRLGDADARTASDHALHGRGVRAASRREDGGKLLNKTLDKRHETAVRRFSKASTSEELRALWTQSLDHGEIAGPYWAILTHPATDTRLAQDVFGDIHMLSHQVGAAARLDIARLRKLEADLAEREDRLARQQARLASAARERAALAEIIQRLEGSLASHAGAAPTRAPEAHEIEEWRRRLADESARANASARKLEASEASRLNSEAEARAAVERTRELEQELAALETLVKPADKADRELSIIENLGGAKILYVGGRPKLIDQLQAFVDPRGGVLLSHDGGVDDSLARLAGLVSQADMVYFPVDCVSHAAAEKVKMLCRRLAKSWSPLRSASLASFVRALGDRAGEPIGVEAE